MFNKLLRLGILMKMIMDTMSYLL